MRGRRETELVPLLVRAEAKLRQLGDAPIWPSYKDGPAIADFLLAARMQIERGQVDPTTLRELWGIFAPTSDWDDVIGDDELGNAIFDILNEIER